MDEKELKKLTDDINAELAKLQKAVQDGSDKAVTIKDELTSKIEGLTKVEDKSIADYAKEIQNHVNTLDGRIKEIEQKGAAKTEDIETQLDKMLSSQDYKDAVKTLKQDGSRAGFQKLVKVMTVGSDLGGTYPVTPSREPGVSAHPRVPLLLFDLIQKGTTDSNRVEWIERNTETPGTAMKAENNQFGESTYQWRQQSMPVEKITDMVKLTREMLEDAEFVRSEIMTILNFNIPYLREYQVLTGNGSTPNLKGLLTYAKTFSLPTGVDGVADPNNYDALKAAILQVNLGINSGQKTGFFPNACVLNPVDAVNMELEKDANNNYILPPFKSAGGLAISGVPVITTPMMTVGSFLVGDLSVMKAFIKRGIEINFWDQNSTDPEYDRVTVTASHRLALRVTAEGAYGLVTGTFAAALEALAV
jgi:HK97 family phage major capsid protein